VAVEKEKSKEFGLPAGFPVRYQLGRLIARGGTASVYEARLHGYRVALKAVKLDDWIKKGFKVNEFFEEARVMTGIQKDFVPTVYETLLEGEYLCMAMELVDGRTLKEVLKEKEKSGPGSLKEEEVVRLGERILEMLVTLQERPVPVIHGDLKPSNIMVTSTGRLMLLDFGASFAHEGGIFGTRGYAAPEVMRGKRNIQSDLYSVGMMLRELLLGEGIREETKYVSVREWRPEISRELDGFLIRCTMEEPGYRYSSAEEALAALRKAKNRQKASRRKASRELKTLKGTKVHV